MSRRKAFAKIEDTPAEIASPTETRRLMDAALKGIRSSMVGRLHLTGRLPASEFAAAKRWAELVADYGIACQAPRQPQTMQLDSRGGTPADLASEKGQKEARRHRQATAAWLQGRHALRRAGLTVERVVNDVVIADAPVDMIELQALRTGLQALLACWSSRRTSIR